MKEKILNLNDPVILDDSGEEFIVEFSPLVKEQMEKDPKLAQAMREFSAMARQAMHGVKAGQYNDFNEAIEALTGNKPELVGFFDEEE